MRGSLFLPIYKVEEKKMKGGGGYTFSPPHGCRETQKDRVRASLFLPSIRWGKTEGGGEYTLSSHF